MRLASSHVRVHQLGRDRWIGRIALLTLWGGAIAMTVWGGGGDAVVCCLLPFALLGGTSLILGLNHGRTVAGSRASGSRGHLRLDGDVLEVEAGGRVHRWPVADIVTGWSEPARREVAGRTGDMVVIGTRSGQFVSLLVPEKHTAQDVLYTVGITPDQRAVVLRLGVHEPGAARALMIFLSLVLGGLLLALIPIVAWMVVAALSGDAVPIAIPIVLTVCVIGGGALLFNGLLRPLLPATLRIGTDGVVVERLLRKRLVRRSEIERVRMFDRFVEILCRDGTLVPIPAAGPAEAEAVATCLAQALAETTSSDVRPALRDKLDRGGRTLAAWLRDLRALAKGASGYREAASDPRELLDIAKDGAAPAERRVAAAAVLGNSGDPQMRIALRGAAASCADPRLRVAIEKAAGGAIEEADLDGLHDDTPQDQKQLGAIPP